MSACGRTERGLVMESIIMLKEIFWEMSYGDEIMCSQARRQELTLDTEVEFLLDAVV